MIDRLRAIIDRFGEYSKEGRTVDVQVGSRSVSVATVTTLKMAMALVVVSAGTIGAGVGFLGAGSQSVLAVDVAANDVSISTASGNVTGVLVEPNVTVSWNNLDDGVEEVEYRVFVGPSESSLEPTAPTTTGSGSCTGSWCGNRTGSYSVIGFGHDITSDSDFYGPVDTDPAPFDRSDFNASEGQTKTTTVYVKMEVRLIDSSGNVINSANSTLTSFTVSVTNTEGTVSMSGEFNTSVNTPS